MTNRERIVIYAALALLAGLNLLALSNAPGATAAAQDDPGAPALGPAASLTLSGDEPLVVRNGAGRVAWGDSPVDRAHSVAFVHVGRAMGPLLEAEHYREEYTRLSSEIQATDDELSERIQAFQEEHQGLDPEDPDAGVVQRAFQELVQERERFRREGTRRLGRLAADQIERAYRDFVAAVEVVAANRGIDIVLRFIPTANEFRAANPPAAHTSVRSRIAVVYPQALDITDDVMEELDL